MFRSSIEENLATILIGFGVYECVYSKSSGLLKLPLDPDHLTWTRAGLVVAIVVSILLGVRFKETLQTSKRRLGYQTHIAVAATFALFAVFAAYAGFGDRPAFCILLGIVIYALLIEKRQADDQMRGRS